jgi:2-polyprenyl-3-methyl-5-hydroxy-6-metoxy-1,4-benzoquinol methylase
MRYKSKKDWIIPYVTGKKVLDLGCVQHSLDHTKKSDWLHGIIKTHAKSVLGVDYLKDEVSALVGQGYNMVCENVETMQLQDTFEIIVAGDIIEHLSNCGQFMERVCEHLTQDGLFLVSTPNPITFLRFMRWLLLGRVSPNKEHTCWFTADVLGVLAERYGLEVVNVSYIDLSRAYWSVYPVFLWPLLALNYFLCWVGPHLCDAIGIVLRKKKSV